MIIWTGRGILVPMFPLATCLAAYGISNALLGPTPGGSTNLWPAVVGMLVAAAVSWYLGLHFRNREAKVLLDPKTGQEVVIRKEHSLYFLPMHWWGVIFAIIALLCLGFQLFN